MINRVRVRLGERSYEAWVGRGVLSRRLPWGAGRAFVLFDSGLPSAARLLLGTLRAQGWEARAIPVPAGERLKRVEALYPLYGKLLELGADRDSVLFALGGGSIGDAIGFLAATFLRGVRWVGVPTTLLAQVDSSLGGKTGINHPRGKNLIGAFHQPTLVLCELGFLDSLSHRDRVSGLGEIAKCGIALDSRLFRALSRSWPRVLELESPTTERAVAACLAVKARVVEKDEYERRGIRDGLNFGHTVGHAIEAVTGYRRFRHGEAVIWGMRAEIALSAIRGHLGGRERGAVDGLLAGIPVPPVPRSIRAEALADATRFDKKKEKGKTRFALIGGIGSVVLDHGVATAELLRAIREAGVAR